MNFQITLALLLAASVISFQDEDGGDHKIARKHYGLNFHSKCIDYVKTFTCMTTCKSIGFQIFRMDVRCKCSCHGLKTTTILPFFKWRTNGTTKTLPSTQSPNLYHIAGTLSPAPTETEETSDVVPVTCVTPEPTNFTASDNTTTNDESRNTTSVDDESATTDETATDESTQADGDATTTVEGGDMTTNSENESGQTTDEGGANTATIETGGTEAGAEETTIASEAPDE